MDAEALVCCALHLTGALAQGGRVVAAGSGRAATDADHIVVQFLYPVGSGKRALPAVHGRRAASANDVVLTVRYGATPALAVGECQLMLPGTVEAEAKEAAVVSYHLLWELVHAILEQPPNASALDYERSTQARLSEAAALRAKSIERNDAALTTAAEILATAGSLYTFGNGASSTDAADLAYAAGDKALSLAADPATVTAVADQAGFDAVFAAPLATLGRVGDAAVGLSANDDSANVAAGLEQAAGIGMRTVGLAGRDDCRMAQLDGLDALLVVPSTSVHRIQETQVALYNEALRRAGLAPKPKRERRPRL